MVLLFPKKKQALISILNDECMSTGRDWMGHLQRDNGLGLGVYEITTFYVTTLVLQRHAWTRSQMARQFLLSICSTIYDLIVMMKRR